MTTIEIKIRRNDYQATPGKLAEAELHFTGGELDGLKLVGFAIWEARNGEPRYVSLPARQFAVDGARCSFILLRWIEDPKAQDRLRDLVLQAYARHEAPIAQYSRCGQPFAEAADGTPEENHDRHLDGDDDCPSIGADNATQERPGSHDLRRNS